MLENLFNYVDFHSIRDNKPDPAWTRIHISKIPEVREDHDGANCFVTIQQFKSNVHEDGELQFAPIYFDLDFKDDVEVALLDARQLISYFSQMGVPAEHARIWFSGSKGFHIVLTPEIFGIRPHEELTYIIKNACMYTAAQLSIKSFDRQVYSIRRMWRLADSVHQKTQLYCVELSHSELMQFSLEHIKMLAKVPRGQIYDPETYENVETVDTCKLWLTPFIQDYQTQRELANLRPKHPIQGIPGKNPVCIDDLLKNSIRREGTRNQGEMALVSYYKDIGADEATTTALVGEWAKQVPKNLTSKNDKRALDADVKGVVRTVFDADHGNKYHFACHFIRALGSGAQKPIACTHDKCEFIKQEDQEPEEVMKLKLPEASRSVYIGKRFISEVMIAGKDDTPYGVPVHIEVKCSPDVSRENSVCKTCAIVHFNGQYDFKYSTKDPQILGLIDIGEAQQKNMLRKKCGIPERCPKHKMTILNFTNITEVLLIPRIDFRPETINEDEPYVVRKGYYVGHDIEINKEYRIIASTVPDPKTQHIVHLIDHVELLTDDIIQFKMTDEIAESLKKFQVRTD